MKIPPRFRALFRSIAINGLLVGTSFLVAAFVAEVLIRVIAPQQLIQIRPDIWQPADTVGWLARPNVNTEINTGERTVSIRTDYEGYRVGRNGRREGQHQVLLIGDSFMQALQVQYEASTAGRLEVDLSKRLGVPVAVRNAGVAGWGPSQYYLRTRSLLARDSFDLVVVAFYVGNDVSRSRRDRIGPRVHIQRNGFRVPRRLTWKEFVDALMRPVNDLLEVRSHFFILAKNRLQTLRMRLGLSPAYFPDVFRLSEADEPRWSVAADLSLDLAMAAAAHSTPVLFVLVPTPFQVDTASFREYVAGFGIDSTTVDLDQPNRILLSEFRTRGLNVIDALSVFRAAQHDQAELYGTVDPHLSPAGHQELADFVAPYAEKLLLAPKLGGSPHRSVSNGQ